MKSKILFCGFLVFMFILNWGCNKTLRPEEMAAVDSLKVELSITRNEIQDATSKEALYFGGLIKTLITLRLEILKINEALIKQRINAYESGTDVSVEVKTIAVDTLEANKILGEIDKQKIIIGQAKTEADMYSGGLLLSLKLTQVATEENTLAMLRQKYLSAKYGLLINTKIQSNAVSDKKIEQEGIEAF